jgi:hypothetical protein
MPRRRLTFRQRDVRAAIRAIESTGLKVTEVKITPDGEIIVSTSSEEVAAPASKKNAWDDLYENPPKLR